MARTKKLGQVWLGPGRVTDHGATERGDRRQWPCTTFTVQAALLDNGATKGAVSLEVSVRVRGGCNLGRRGDRAAAVALICRMSSS
jgi:hypothetical protein